MRHILFYIHTKFDLLDIKNNRDMAIFKRTWRPFWIFFSYSGGLGAIKQSLLSILRKKEKKFCSWAGRYFIICILGKCQHVQQSLHTKFPPLNMYKDWDIALSKMASQPSWLILAYSGCQGWAKFPIDHLG